MSLPIKAAGYIILNDSPIIQAIGASPREAWVKLISDVAPFDKPNKKNIQKYIDDGFYVQEATQELLDMINDYGGDISWNEVNGINCTDEQWEEYKESLLNAPA